MRDKILVFLPTYNEASNISSLIEKILFLGDEFEVLVVDDSSSDGTADLVRELVSKNYKNVHLIERKFTPRGRGFATVEAFSFFIREKKYNYLIEMDADFSHSPEDIPKLILAAKDSGAGLVVGSRYVKGGGEENRKLKRRFLSYFANLYIRFMLPSLIKDSTSGFRLYKYDVIDKIYPYMSFAPYGPAIVIFTLKLVQIAGYKIIEVPIIYKEREKGESKLNILRLLECLKYANNSCYRYIKW